MFERNLAAKLRMPEFAADIGPLLAPGYDWNMEEGETSAPTRRIRPSRTARRRLPFIVRWRFVVH